MRKLLLVAVAVACLPAVAAEKWNMFERRLGMFVHWGIYSVGGLHEQEQCRYGVPRDEYEKYMDRFLADKFSPDDFIDVAESAGAEYIVITTKHHDGFCMWDTATTDFKVTNTPAKRDVIGELAAACRRRGMKLGFYYSNPDWHHPNAYNDKSTHQVAPQPGDAPDMGKYISYVKAQVTELLTKYGEVVCFFWDIPTGIELPEMDGLVRKLQPGIMINDRGWENKKTCDYSTPERDYKWALGNRHVEACDAVGVNSWGYRVNEDYRTLGYLSRNIDRYLSTGGNYLLNVGPKSDGAIPDEARTCMASVGRWYAKVRESFRDVVVDTNLTDSADIAVTRRNEDVYLHFRKPVVATGVFLPKFDRLPDEAVVLNTGTRLRAVVEMAPWKWNTPGAKPSLHLMGIPADELANEAVVIRIALGGDGYAASEATLRGEDDVTLAEGWRFAKDSSGKADWSAEAFDDSSWRAVRVPHDWAIEGPFSTNDYSGSTGRLPWKGVGWYRLHFDVSEAEAEGCVFLDFDGVMASPEVYVNGRRAGGWDYGYASFRVDATPFVRPGANVLAVRASTLDHAARWYPGAGVYRRVVKRTRSRAHFAYNGIFVTTPEVSRRRALVRVSWETENAPADAKVKVRVSRNDRIVGEGVAPAAAGTVQLKIENPDLWDVDDPALHDAEVTLADAEGRAISRETVRFGIRSIAFPVPDDPKDRAANGFHLNGRRVQLRGVNNHSDLGLLGMAFDKSAARRQLRIMKDMGANALRMSHNPPAPELLDLCDEMGILVWDEAFDKWDAYGGRREDQPLEEYVASNLVAFVRRDRNHPSVIVWSIGNEIWEWDPVNPIRDPKNPLTDHGPSGQTRERNTFFRDQVRLVDATRPVGNGNRPSMNKDRVFDLGIFDPLDVVGWNYNHSYAAFKKRYPKKVVIYSESASAISSYGVYLDNALGGRKAATRQRGDGPPQVDSRDLQSIGDIVDEALGFMDDDPYCCGDFVWTGFDYLGEPAPFWKEARSSYFGIVALTGVPKDRYYLYRSNWNRKSPTLHVSPDTWTFPGKEGQNVPVMVYTDANEAELFLNGRSLGRRRKGEKVPVPASVTNGNFSVFRRYRLMWLDVPYEKGELKAVAIRNGKAAEEKVLRTAGAPARLKIEVEPTAGKDEEELVWLHAYAYDVEGNRTLSAVDEVEFSISGPGTILGVGNGDPCEHVSFASPKGHRLFGGVATAVVRRTGPGALAVRVSSPTLSSAAATL